MSAIIVRNVGRVSHGQSLDSSHPSRDQGDHTIFSGCVARFLDFSAVEYFSQSVEMEPSISRKTPGCNSPSSNPLTCHSHE